MSKDRPFKNFKTPTERPFKTYNPGGSSSMLFQDQQAQQQQQQQQQQLQQQQHQQQQQQQQLRLGAINSLMQQQQPQHMAFVQQQQAAAVAAQQVYGDPDDYLHLNPLNPQQRGVGVGGLQQNPMMNIDPSLNSYYEDLGLDDSENPLIRSDLLVSNDSILQREQDLNIGQSPGLNNNNGPVPNFLVHNRHAQQRAQASLAHVMAGTPDSLSMLFDQSQQQALSPFSPSASLQQQQQALISKAANDRICAEAQQQQQQQATNGSHFPNVMTSQGALGAMMGANNPIATSNGRSATVSVADMLSSPSDMGGVGIDSYPVKREADEGARARSSSSPSPPAMQQQPSPPSQSDSFGDSPKQQQQLHQHGNGHSHGGLKRSMSNSSAGSSAMHGEGGSGGAGKLHHHHHDNGHGSGSGGDSSCTNGEDPDGDDCGDSKDPGYLEKRRKNNESAKRSREARRNKEELVALRVITLEEENMKLRAEISLLDKELDELRARLFS